jgi:hypothetical protein
VHLVKREIMRHGRTLRSEHQLTRKLSEILAGSFVFEIALSFDGFCH